MEAKDNATIDSDCVEISIVEVTRVFEEAESLNERTRVSQSL